MLSRPTFELKLLSNGVQLEEILKTPLPMAPAERRKAIGWLFSQLRKVLDDWKMEQVKAAVALPRYALIPPRANLAVNLLSPELRVPVRVVYGREPLPPTVGKANVITSPQKVSFVQTFKYQRLVQGGHSETLSAYWTNSRSGVDLPKFRSIIRDGGNATTPLTATRQIFDITSGFCEVTFRGEPGSYEVAGDAISGSLAVGALAAATDGGLLAKCNTESLRKFHKRLAAITRSADVGESLGEFAQTIRMVRRPLAGMRDLIEKTERQLVRVRRSRLGSPATTRLTTKDVAQAAAKLHLEFNFGWKPLAMDLLDALKEAQRSRLAICPNKLNASFKADKVISQSQLVTPVWNYFRFDQTERDTLSCTVRHQVGLNPKKVEAYEYMRAIGLSPERFIPTLYAVIPYSWLFDYFTALNVAIDALCADLSFTTWTSKTVRWERKYSHVRAINPGATKKLLGDNLYSLSGSPFISVVTRNDVSRSVPTSLVPDIITLSTQLNAGQAKNIVALLLAKTKTHPFLK